MAEKDVQWGVILIIISVVFLLTSLGVIRYIDLNENFASLMAFILVACGTYLVARK